MSGLNRLVVGLVAICAVGFIINGVANWRATTHPWFLYRRAADELGAEKTRAYQKSMAQPYLFAGAASLLACALRGGEMATLALVWMLACAYLGASLMVINKRYLGRFISVLPLEKKDKT